LGKLSTYQAVIKETQINKKVSLYRESNFKNGYIMQKNNQIQSQDNTQKKFVN